MKTLTLPKLSLLALGLACANASFASSTGAYHFTDLGTLCGNYSIATGINIFGQVVGNAAPADNSTSRAVIWNGVTISELPELDKVNHGTVATGINNSGQISGYANTPVLSGTPNSHSVRWEGSGVTDLGTLGGRFPRVGSMSA